MIKIAIDESNKPTESEDEDEEMNQAGQGEGNESDGQDGDVTNSLADTKKNSQGQGRNPVQNAGEAAKKAVQDKAKKVLKNKKLMAFIATHFIPILVVVLVILKIIGLVGQYVFFTSMPGLVLEKLKEFGLNVWSNFVGFFTGDPVTAQVTQDDVVQLAQYLQNMGYDIESCGLGKAEYEDADPSNPSKTKTLKKIGASVDGKEYLKAYIAANEATYVMSNYSLNGFLQEIGSQFVAFIEADPNEIQSNKETSTGMINILNTSITEDAKYAKIDRKNEKMIVYTNAVYLPILKILGSDGKIQWGSMFSYDLSSWTARYGKPQELLLAIHLSTMMPDLAYRVAKDPELNTKVNLVFQDVDIDYTTNVKSIGGNASNLTEMDIINAFLQYGLANGKDDNYCTVDIEDTSSSSTSSDSSTGSSSSSSTGSGGGNPNNTNVPSRVSYFNNSDVTFSGGGVTITPNQYTIQKTTKVASPDISGGGGSTTTTTVATKKEKVYYPDLWSQVLANLDDNGKMQVFDNIMDALSNGLLYQLSKWWGINYAKYLPDDIDLNQIIRDSSSGSIVGSIGANSYYVYIIDGEDIVPGLGISHDALLELAEIVGKGRRGISDVKWPYIQSVTNHWYYNDIDFSGASDSKPKPYRKARVAKKRIIYEPDSEESALRKENIQVELDAYLTAEEGVVYQVCEPEADGPNQHIVDIFNDKYYKYDGTIETAKMIDNAKNAGSPDVYTDGSVSDYYKSLVNEGKSVEIPTIEKQAVSFQGNKTNALAAFQMLEDMHSEASDFIYRNLKDLVVALNYFTEEELTTELKSVMQWIIKTDNPNEEFDITKDTEEYGMVIKNVDEREVIAPENCYVGTEGDVVTLKFMPLSDETVEFLEFVYKDDYKSINKDILTGLTMKIKGLKSVKTGRADRGAQIGTASSELIITIQDMDKSLIEDIEEYMSPEHNSSYENAMKKKKDEKYENGIDIGRVGPDALRQRKYTSNFDPNYTINIDDIKQKVFDLLKAEGIYTYEGICSIMAIMQAESSFVISAENATERDQHTQVRAGYGLIQWTNQRRTRLENWCNENMGEGSYATLEGQVAFFTYELRTYYSEANGYHHPVYETLTGSNDLEYALEMFLCHAEAGEFRSLSDPGPYAPQSGNYNTMREMYDTRLTYAYAFYRAFYDQWP